MNDEQIRELKRLAEMAGPSPSNPENWDFVTIEWLKSRAGRNDAALFRAARPAIISLADEVLRLREQLTVALEHVRELEDAWMRGAIREHDGKGGTRSNRNRDVRVALESALAAGGR